LFREKDQPESGNRVFKAAFYLPAAGGRKTYSSRDCECLLSMRWRNSYG
jgi:hypothetical protein